MRYLFFIISILFLFNCNNKKHSKNEIDSLAKTGLELKLEQKIEKESQSQIKSQSEIEKDTVVVINNSLDSSVVQIRLYLINKSIKSPETYKPISWGKVEIINAPSFKYRVLHKFRCSNLYYHKNDTISGTEYEIVFHLDSLGKVVAATDLSNYSQYYTQEGLQYISFSSLEFEKIGIKNTFEVLYNKEGSKTLQVVGGLAPRFGGKVGMTKSKFLDWNFKGLETNILRNIDSVDYYVDISAMERELYIFKSDTLSEIISDF